MSIETIESRLKPRLIEFSPLKARIKFELSEGGCLFVDALQMPPTLSRDSAEADCTITASGETMEKLMDGSLNPTLAFTLGKLKISGSMGLAMKIAALLED